MQRNKTAAADGRTTPAADVVFYASAVDIDTARRHAFDWLASMFGAGASGTVAEQLPTPVSPTGQLPATGYICAAQYMPNEFRSAQQYARRRNTPIEFFEIELSAFLAGSGLQIINAD